jgi:hypothetical protein
MSESFQLVVVVCNISEHARDPKVCETCLAIPSDQDVTLDTPMVNDADLLISSFYLPE